ncbi:MAG: nickel pincer cofactor biosynthesis protein LarC [Anaerolineae bacterium]|nr:nickel pincer cofactor biosynthesis protein LarC [Anaerolineae bacterium]
MNTIAYFDCFSGISGNMVLGALLDAGLELDCLEAELARLPISGYKLKAETVKRRGMQSTYVEVEVSEQGVERHLHHIEEIITGSGLPDTVQQRGLAIFRRLAQAEAKVHGAPVESIHFHEVGAMDAIVDVMGAAIGLWLLGVEKAYASPVHVGRGTVKCAHGILPVPAPATLELLQGVPIYGRDVDAELVTPTGAAILTTVAESFGQIPLMRVKQIGYGAGTRELPIPNLLRLSIGEAAAVPAKGGEQPVPPPWWGRTGRGGTPSVFGTEAGYGQDAATLIETNIDDMNPQWYEHVTTRLFEAGALDVFLTPIQMKRGRPAIQLSVLVADDLVPQMLDVLFAETTTIGVRAHPVQRWKLTREIVTVETEYGPVAVKVARRGETVLNVTPEYRDCQRVAAEHGAPLKQVHQAALEAARRQLDRQQT